MASVTIDLQGTSSLLMHNIRLADPDDLIAREIAAIAKKRTKTVEDRAQMARLEWFGGLYLGDNGRIVMPTANVRKCLIQAAKVTKQGTALGRALHFADLDVPLEYGGPRDPEELYKRPEYSLRAAVGISGSRTMRVRPQFRTWSVRAPAELIEDVLDPAALARIVALAGLIEGLGDNRINGYGRFVGRVTAGREEVAA